MFPIHLLKEAYKPAEGNPHNDTIVIITLVANCQIGSIWIDTGSSVNIIFKFIFKKMNLLTSQLTSTAGPLYSCLTE
ncbi:hypothetical protein MA16_Dca009761 [Dendrobium catenatum]|uniref:Uncharacterized protein n=1 Tax=Dendrobium catenatum TaxID=906689 RepID=A0A2I0VZ62_9ASPA|nr:hypothetical protein MA16_Dca009761 [Dendrobium catenatum]